MVKEKAKWWKTPPGSNIVGGLAVALILYIVKLAYDWYTITPILSTVGEWLDFIRGGFMDTVNFQLKLWWILVGILAIAMFKYLLYLFDIDDNTNQRKDESPGVYINDMPIAEFDAKQAQQRLQCKLDYTAEKINGTVYKWQWIYNELIKSHEIKYITPCCKNPECKNEGLKTTAAADVFSCQTCKKFVTINDDQVKIENHIEKRAAQLESPFYLTFNPRTAQ